MNNDNFGSGPSMAGGAMLTFLLGAVVGASVALLMAPATGEDTRRKLTDAARRVGSNVGDTVSSAKDELKSRKEDVLSAVNAGRDAYSRARSSGEPAPTSSAM
jgi:gas vesicle protein